MSAPERRSAPGGRASQNLRSDPEPTAAGGTYRADLQLALANPNGAADALIATLRAGCGSATAKYLRAVLVGGAAPADRELVAGVLALAVRTGVATGRLTVVPIPGGDDALLVALDGEGVTA